MNNIDISIINDEISNDFNEVISFCIEQNLNFIDIRSFKGKNISELSYKEATYLHKSLVSSGISVSSISSPLFKWYQRNDNSNSKPDLYYMKSFYSMEEKKDLIKRTLDICSILKSPSVRVFSGLQSDTSSNQNFFEKEIELYTYLLSIANNAGIKIMLENEPECNFNTVKDMLSFGDFLFSKEISILLDIGNIYKQSLMLNLYELKKVCKFLSNNIHIKDIDLHNKKFVPFGDGDIPYGRFLEEIFKSTNHDRHILTIETHVLQDKKNASAKSLENLRKYISYLNL